MKPALLTSVKLLIIVQLIYLLIRLFLQLGASMYTHPYSGFRPNFRSELEAAKLTDGALGPEESTAYTPVRSVLHRSD